MIKVDKIYNKLEELIIFYQNYLDNHEDASLDILIDDDSINFYLNDRIYDIVKKIIEVQDKVFINDDLPLVVDLNKKAKLSYPEEFMNILNKRIELSKKLRG